MTSETPALKNRLSMLHRSLFRNLSRNQQKPYIAVSFCVALGLVALLVSSKPNLSAIFLAPSLLHPLGTNLLGQDIVSMLFEGVFYSVVLSLSTVVLSGVVGTLTALLCIANRNFRVVAQLLANMLIVIPPFVICLLLIARWKSSALVLVVGQFLAFSPLFLRLAHKEFLDILKSDFAQTSIYLGNHVIPVLYKHSRVIFLPKLRAQFFSLMSVAIGIESGLSYLGMGPPLPQASLGNIIADSMRYWALAAWYPIASIMTLFLLMGAISWITYDKTKG